MPVPLARLGHIGLQSCKLPSDGYFEIWSRATDGSGTTQPFAAADWNPQGYGANPYHRIAVLVG